MPPDIVGATGQFRNRQRKPCGFPQRALLIDQVALVEREQHLSDAGQRVVGAASNMRLLAASSGELAVLDGKQDFPLKAPDQRITERPRIRLGERLEVREASL